DPADATPIVDRRAAVVARLVAGPQPGDSHQLMTRVTVSRVISLWLSPGYETSYYGRPPVYDRCGVGRIICSEELPDGRFALLLRGVARVEIARELPTDRTYRMVEARVLTDASCDPTDARD